ncbi:MAG TPA: hypothetical protein VFV10_02385 [Gammaproteobacteria bacterium]|nr:hypothetical protein [Gammaproteobacteria bacterium]
MRVKLLTLLLVAAAPIVRADTLLLDSIEANKATASSRPRGGMSMDKVEAQFGAPIERHAAVGEPPITRWDYPTFSVYFEYQLVIHAVPSTVEPSSAAPSASASGG